jgi:hypothetical protein
MLLARVDGPGQSKRNNLPGPTGTGPRIRKAGPPRQPITNQPT